MTSPFPSRASNAQDVVLWRALGHVADGRAVELNSTSADNLGALAESGWKVTGISEVAELAEAASHELAGQTLHVLCGGDDEVTAQALQVLAESGIMAWVVVSVSGDRASAKRHAQHRDDVHRPILDAGYLHCSFDGMNNLFLHTSHAELREALSYSACSLDNYTTPAQRAVARERDLAVAERDALQAELAEATGSVVRWRAAALHRWESKALGTSNAEITEELAAMRNTLSWRVTRPLRAVRGRIPSSSDGR